MKTLRLLLLMATLFAGQLFSQEYPEITFEDLQNYNYVAIEGVIYVVIF